MHGFLWMVVFASAIFAVQSHSYLSCVDLRSQPSVASDGECFGFPRGYARQAIEGDGYTYRPAQNNLAPCDPQRQRRQPGQSLDHLYTERFPMTIASPGQKLTLRWPANNHANDSNLINSGWWVYIYGVRTPDLTEDPTQAEYNNWLLTKLRYSVYCDQPQSPGSRKCFGSLVLPQDLQGGIYSFQWWWPFGSELFSTCFDVNVRGQRGPTPRPKPKTNTPLPTKWRPTPTKTRRVPTVKPGKTTAFKATVKKASPTLKKASPTFKGSGGQKFACSASVSGGAWQDQSGQYRSSLSIRVSRSGGADVPVPFIVRVEGGYTEATNPYSWTVTSVSGGVITGTVSADWQSLVGAGSANFGMNVARDSSSILPTALRVNGVSCTLSA